MEQFAPLVRSKDQRPIRYLVVDDSIFARKNLAKMIESFGGQVAGEAGDGCTAIAEYSRTQPDIVLMDITMPQMEGIEAAERIVRQSPDARIVMVSSVGYQENIIAALQKGARHFVQKPVKPEVLYEVVKYVLGDSATASQAEAAGRGDAVKMELIQPFINAADAVLAQALQEPTTIGAVSMEEEAYRRKGIAAMVLVNGDIEGRVIFDLEPKAARVITSKLMGTDNPDSDEFVPEAICELANQVIGNAVTVLNDQGFNFKVHPPEVHTAPRGIGNSEDTEAVVMCFETNTGAVFMNIAMRYNRRRKNDGD